MTNILAALAYAAAAGGDITAGRARSLVGLAAALIALIIGAVAAARSDKQRTRGFTALIVGLIAALLSVLHLATATGAIGTGSGKLGATLALVVALIGMSLGALAIARSHLQP